MRSHCSMALTTLLFETFSELIILIKKSYSLALISIWRVPWTKIGILFHLVNESVTTPSEHSPLTANKDSVSSLCYLKLPPFLSRSHTGRWTSSDLQPLPESSAAAVGCPWPLGMFGAQVSNLASLRLSWDSSWFMKAAEASRHFRLHSSCQQAVWCKVLFICGNVRAWALEPSHFGQSAFLGQTFQSA